MSNVPVTLVDVVMDCESVTMPAVVNWETGALKSEKAPDVVCSFRKNKMNSLSGREIFMQAEDQTFRSRDHPMKDSHTFIAVHNKKTNEVQWLLSEYLIAKPVADLDTSTVDLVNDLSNRFKNVQDLKHAFGSKRSKRMADQAARLKSNLNQLNESVNEAIADKEINLEDINIHTAADLYKDILPPCNRNAENPEDVYNLDDLITESELDDFQELAVAAQNSSPEELSENCSKFFQDVLSSALFKRATEKQIKILLYADTLVQFAELRPLTKQGIKGLCPTYRIFQKIKNVYNTNNQKFLSRMMLDKVVCHIFVLLFLSSDFKIFYNFLSNCSPIFRNKHNLLRIIGATPIMKTNESAFVLRTPLPSLPTGMKYHR